VVAIAERSKEVEGVRREQKPADYYETDHYPGGVREHRNRLAALGAHVVPFRDLPEIDLLDLC